LLGVARRSRRRSDRRPIWIGNGEVAKDLTLGLFHGNCVFAPFVIVADEVQKTMDGKMGKMMGKRLSLGASLARNGLEGQNDVAKVAGGGVIRWE
jgi:hypothetical protein